MAEPLTKIPAQVTDLVGQADKDQIPAVLNPTTVDKPNDATFGLTLNVNYASDFGKYAFAIRQLDYADFNLPEDWQYATVIRTEGSILTTRAIVSSGHTNGVVGDGYDIQVPAGGLIPFMFAAWGDVAGPCFLSRTSGDPLGTHFLAINNQNKTCYFQEHNGGMRWTQVDPSASGVALPVYDIALDRLQPGRLTLSGSNGFVGELAAPKYLVMPAALTDDAIVVYDTTLQYRLRINGKGQWVQHHGDTPGFQVVGASGQSTNYIEALPFGSSTPVAYINFFGEIGTTGPTGGVKVHDRANNTHTFEFYSSTNLNVTDSTNGNILVLSPTGALTTTGNITATGTLQATGASSQIGLNRRDNSSQAAAIYSASGGVNVFLNAIGADAFSIATSGKVMIGAGSTPLAKILSVTATLDFGSTAAQTSADLTVTVTGAAVGDSVSFGLPAAPPANTGFVAWVSAANTITMRFNNYSSAAVDPPSGLYRVTVQSF